MLEQVVVAGVAADGGQVKFTLQNLKDSPGLGAMLFGALSKASIVVDIIVQDVPSNGIITVSFTVGKSDYLKARDILQSLQRGPGEFTAMKIVEETDLAKVSVVGVGMQHHPGVASKMFSLLAEAGINIKLITTSEIKISCLIDGAQMKPAVECLHRGFELHRYA
jgi:aspartate kinase